MKVKQAPKLSKDEIKERLTKAIELLNSMVKIKIAPSSIHGVGVIAMRDMKKGEVLNADAIPHAFDVPYKKFSELRPDVKEVLLGHWPQIINGSHFLYPVTKMTAFMNHSDKFNYDGKNDKLIRDVKAGEEITENYRVIPNYKKVFAWLPEEML